MEGYQQGGGSMGEKVQGISSINGRYKIDRGRSRIWEMEKLKNLCVRSMDMKKGGGLRVGWEGAGQRGIKRRKKMGQL